MNNIDVLQVSGLVLILGRGKRYPQAGGYDLPVTAHRPEVRLVLEPFIFQPSLDER